MKKIFGISFGALFAALPMMAGAANIDTVNGHGKIVDGDATRAVSVSYVKGAYNELGSAINTKQDQLKNGSNNISSAVSSEVRAIAAENGADNSTLVTELAVRNAIVSAVSSANNTATSAINALDSTVSQTAGTDGLAITVVQEDGKLKSVTGSIAANTYDAYGAATSAVNALTSSVSQTAAAGNGQLQLTVTQQSGVITGVSGSIAENTYDAYGAATSAATSALNSAKSYADSVASAAETAAKGHADTLNTAMDARVDDLEAANSALSGTYATKTGVENVINSATFKLSNAAVSGTVTAMSTWGSDATSTIQMTGSVTNTDVKADSTTVSYATANPSA